MNPEPITLPLGWTVERDCAHFEEVWGRVPDYRIALHRRTNHHCIYFATAIDLSVRCFTIRDPNLLALDPACWPVAEQITLLQEFVRGGAYTGRHRA